MTPNIVLDRKLGEATRRIRTLLVLKWTGRTLCWTALACLLWLLASKLNWVDEPEPRVIGGILGFAAVAGILIGCVSRLAIRDVARLTDKRTSMKERLASAVEFQGLSNHDPLVRRQILDANEHAGMLDLRKVYPFKFSRELIAFIVVAAILFG